MIGDGVVVIDGFEVECLSNADGRERVVASVETFLTIVPTCDKHTCVCQKPTRTIPIRKSTGSTSGFPGRSWRSSTRSGESVDSTAAVSSSATRCGKRNHLEGVGFWKDLAISETELTEGESISSDEMKEKYGTGE
jgi:hypothetical protein